jgi:hypothetical protein
MSKNPDPNIKPKKYNYWLPFMISFAIILAFFWVSLFSDKLIAMILIRLSIFIFGLATISSGLIGIKYQEIIYRGITFQKDKALLIGYVSIVFGIIICIGSLFIPI